MTVNNLIAIVTGGSKGIGLAICKTLSAQGYQVYNLDVQPPSDTGLSGEWLECDISDHNQVQETINKVIASCGAVHVLVSNAGIHFSGDIESTSPAQLQRVFDINVKGAYSAIQAVLPAMKRQSAGSIILMASDQAFVAKARSFAYNLSKAALASMAKTTAVDYAPFNIRANAVCPGTIETPLYHNAVNAYVERSGDDKDAVHAAEAAAQPLGRLGQPEEVAELVAFLASEKSAFITGSLYAIDGGYTAQ